MLVDFELQGLWAGRNYRLIKESVIIVNEITGSPDYFVTDIIFIFL